MFDVKSKSDSVFQKKSSKKERLTRVLTQTDHNTQEPLDVGIRSTTLANLTIHSNVLRDTSALAPTETSQLVAGEQIKYTC